MPKWYNKIPQKGGVIKQNITIPKWCHIPEKKEQVITTTSKVGILTNIEIWIIFTILAIQIYILINR